LSHGSSLEVRVHVPAVPHGLSRGKYLYLPNVRVPPAVLVLDDRDLHEHGLDVGLQDLAGGALLLELESEPADGLLEIDQLDFLELIE
jgi:hypothetical protein